MHFSNTLEIDNNSTIGQKLLQLEWSLDFDIGITHFLK